MRIQLKCKDVWQDCKNVIQNTWHLEARLSVKVTNITWVSVSMLLWTRGKSIFVIFSKAVILKGKWAFYRESMYACTKMLKAFPASVGGNKNQEYILSLSQVRLWGSGSSISIKYSAVVRVSVLFALWTNSAALTFNMGQSGPAAVWQGSTSTACLRWMLAHGYLLCSKHCCLIPLLR